LDTKTRSPKDCVVCPIEFGLAQNYQKYGGSARSVIGLSKIGKLNILNAISQQLQLSMRAIEGSATPKLLAHKDFSSQQADRHT
jgi:hypothetical protein